MAILTLERALPHMINYANLRDVNCAAIGCECTMPERDRACSGDIIDMVKEIREALSLARGETP